MPGVNKKTRTSQVRKTAPAMESQSIRQWRDGAWRYHSRMLRAPLVAAVLLALTLAGGCSDPPEPIAVDGNAITIINSTSNDWRNILIVVNDHYRGGAPLLKADGRLNAPASQFDTGFGQ